MVIHNLTSISFQVDGGQKKALCIYLAQYSMDEPKLKMGWTLSQI